MAKPKCYDTNVHVTNNLDVAYNDNKISSLLFLGLGSSNIESSAFEHLNMY